jgi:hypothetical protein
MIILSEGLGSFVKNLATGDIEKEINELRDEVQDIHTPEQQRYVVIKIVRLLERLIILRHNPNKVTEFIHDSGAWFEKILGNKNLDKELKTRTGEAIRDLSKLRDDALGKKLSGTDNVEETRKLREKVKEVLAKAEKQDAKF